MIRLAIVDDHVRVRHSLREFLQGCPDLQVVAEGRNGAEAVAIAERMAPDVMLMDLAMPGCNGVDALAALRERAPAVSVVILSGYPQELYAQVLLERGAADFVHKNCEPEQIVQTVRAVAERRLTRLADAAA